MAQHDYTIANQSFPNTRSDLNNSLSAIVSNNSGATEPTTTYAYQWWYDETNDILKMRNADNDAWITMFTFNQTADTYSLATDVELTITENLDLTGSATISGDLTVDTNTLFVDSANNEVGIGTVSPDARLHIQATAATSGQDLIKLANGADAAELVIDTSANEINFKTGTGDDIVFLPAGTEVARFTTAGLAIGGTGSANTLDDYEEGTFTPTLTEGTATTQLGSYVKVGNVCHCFINLDELTDITTNAVIVITLPFTAKNGDNYDSVGAVMYRYATLLGNSSLTAYVNDGQAYCQIYQNNSTGNWNQLRYNEITNATNGFKIQLTYFTA